MVLDNKNLLNILIFYCHVSEYWCPVNNVWCKKKTKKKQEPQKTKHCGIYEHAMSPGDADSKLARKQVHIFRSHFKYAFVNWDGLHAVQ